MNSKSICLISLFAALAIILNVIRIPTVYYPGFFYSIFDVSILIAFILYGFKVGFVVEIIHIIGQEIFFPVGTAGIVVYPLGLVMHALMFSGIYLANRLINQKIDSKKNVSTKKQLLYFTGLSTLFRGIIMPIIDFSVMFNILLPLALGTLIPQNYVLSLIPAFFLYNITSTLYVVPIAYVVATKTSSHLKIKAKYLPD